MSTLSTLMKWRFVSCQSMWWKDIIHLLGKDDLFITFVFLVFFSFIFSESLPQEETSPGWLYWIMGLGIFFLITPLGFFFCFPPEEYSAFSIQTSSSAVICIFDRKCVLTFSENEKEKNDWNNNSKTPEGLWLLVICLKKHQQVYHS